MEFLSPRVWLAIVLATVIGFAAGFYTKSKFYAAAEVTQVTKAQHETAQEIVQSAATSQSIETSIQKSNDDIKQVQQVVQQRIAVNQEKRNVSIQPNGSTGAPSVTSCAPDQLDVGTVRLLNAARSGTALGSTGSGDAEVQAAASAPN